MNVIEQLGQPALEIDHLPCILIDEMPLDSLQIGSGMSMVWLEPNRFPEGDHSLDKVALLGQGHSQVIVGIGIVDLEPQGLLVIGHRLPKIALGYYPGM